MFFFYLLMRSRPILSSFFCFCVFLSFLCVFVSVTCHNFYHCSRHSFVKAVNTISHSAHRTQPSPSSQGTLWDCIGGQSDGAMQRPSCMTLSAVHWQDGTQGLKQLVVRLPSGVSRFSHVLGHTGPHSSNIKPFSSSHSKAVVRMTIIMIN